MEKEAQGDLGRGGGYIEGKNEPSRIPWQECRGLGSGGKIWGGTCFGSLSRYCLLIECHGRKPPKQGYIGRNK